MSVKQGNADAVPPLMEKNGGHAALCPPYCRTVERVSNPFYCAETVERVSNPFYCAETVERVSNPFYI